MKSKKIMASLAAIFMVVFIPALFWLGGFDFDQRGEVAVSCLLFTICLAGGSAAMILFPPDK
jgi:hypothetical protein